MPVEINKETGAYEYVDPTKQNSGLTLQEPQLGMSLVERQLQQQNQQLQLDKQKFDERAKAGGDQRPLMAENPGQFMGDLGKVAANAVVSLGTDYLDLAAGLGDVIGQTAQSVMTGSNKYDLDNLFNDSDNPWTRWRRETFKTETQAGQAASHFVRAATALITLPKTAIKGIAAPMKVLSGIDKLGDASVVAGKVFNKLNKLDDVAKAGVAPKVTKAMEGLAKGSQLSAEGRKAANIAAKSNWLTYTYKDISNVPEAASWFKSVGQSAGALTQLGKVKGVKPKLATVGQALAWDAFVAFNIYGEGDSEFDETLMDAFKGWGLPSAEIFQTDVTDSAWSRKMKQMGEGLITGVGLNAVIDMARVYRYSRAFNKATAGDKAKLIAAFNDEAAELGSGIGRMMTERHGFEAPMTSRWANEAMRPGFNPADDPWTGGALARLNDQVAIQRVDNSYNQELLTNEIRAANIRVNPGGELPPGVQPTLPGQQVTGQLEGQGPNAALPPGSSPEPKPPAPERPALGAGGGLVDGRISPVDVRVSEPTVTPQTIRNAFQEDAYNAFKKSLELTYEEVSPGQFEQVKKRIHQLMPRTRVSLMDYMERGTPRLNSEGVMHAADSVWMNFVTQRALSEGWASLDPVTFGLKFNRKLASEIDRAELARKAASKLDERLELDRYQSWLKEADQMNANAGQLDEAVQDNLAKREATDAYDAWEASRPDAPEQMLDREAAQAEVASLQYDAAEEARLTAAEEVAMSGDMPDNQVVREFLGSDLDSVKGPDVEKAEVGRGWVVKSEDGEILGNYTRKSQALKAAESETERLKAAMVNRARQIESDGLDAALNTAIGNPVYDSDLVGKVKLTDAQFAELSRYSTELRKQWKIGKNTYEFTQGHMYDLLDGMKALLQTGEIKGNRARVIKNLMDKLDVQMKLLEPAARAERQARALADDVAKFIDHGEFC